MGGERVDAQRARDGNELWSRNEPNCSQPLGSSLNILYPSSAPSLLKPEHPKGWTQPESRECLGNFQAPVLLPEIRAENVEGCKERQTGPYCPVTTGNKGMCVDRANEQQKSIYLQLSLHLTFIALNTNPNLFWI